MKTFLPLAWCAAALTLLLLSGCGRAARPVSSLPEKDRALLDGYEQIRATLAMDDLKGSKRAGAALLAVLQPTPDAPAAEPVPSVKEIADSTGLDQSRRAFATLSAGVVKLAEGLEGYYVMESPLQKGALWVQRSATVENPYAGKATRDIGALKK